MNKEIKKRRVLCLTDLTFFRKNKNIFILVNEVSKRKNSNSFTDNPLNDSFRFLPIPNNKYSVKNADKWFVIDKNKPKESYSYEIYCKRSHWAGRGKTSVDWVWVEMNKERYHRDYYNPYDIMFVYNKKIDSFVSDPILFNDTNEDLIKNTINLVLNIFGECVITDLDNSYCPNIKIVNWEFLPRGKWLANRDIVKQYIRRGKKSENQNCEHEIDVLLDLNPEDIALGKNGYEGYFAFKFPDYGLCVMESKHINNATYLFELSEWEELSMKTKTEVIENKLAIKRIFHNIEWENTLKFSLKKITK